MPKYKTTGTLKAICIEKILNSLNTYWLRKDSRIKKTLEDIVADHSKIRYFIGPLDRLDDQTVDHMIKTLYTRNQLNGCHLVLLFQYRIKTIDLSFIKKKNIINHSLLNYMGRNCINVVELNLFGQNELKSNWINYMLQFMNHLRKLNLSHTKVNLETIQILSIHCQKLEHLALENCQAIYDDCLELLIKKIPKIESLNVDNIKFKNEVVLKMLMECKYLKLFYVNNLLDIISSSWEDGNRKILMLSRFFIDSHVILKFDKMEALSHMCPNLKQLNINCIGKNDSFVFLANFRALTDLQLGNTTSLNSFKFGGLLLDALQSQFGKQLKTLHLIHLVDVNLRSIAKHCSNLTKLNVEFLGYYEPAMDSSLCESEMYSIPFLVYLSVSNVSTKFEAVHINIGQFRADLTGLVANGKLAYLFIGFMNELNDDFFECLFLTPPYFRGSEKINSHYAYESINTIEFKEMNSISPNLILNFLVERDNCLQELNLINCKQIGISDIKSINSIIFRKNLNLKVKWT